MKNELDKIMKQFIVLKFKIYSYLTDDVKVNKRAKTQ